MDIKRFDGQFFRRFSRSVACLFVQIDFDFEPNLQAKVLFVETKKNNRRLVNCRNCFYWSEFHIQDEEKRRGENGPIKTDFHISEIIKISIIKLIWFDGRTVFGSATDFRKYAFFELFIPTFIQWLSTFFSTEMSSRSQVMSNGHNFSCLFSQYIPESSSGVWTQGGIWTTKHWMHNEETEKHSKKL